MRDTTILLNDSHQLYENLEFNANANKFYSNIINLPLILHGGVNKKVLNKSKGNTNLYTDILDSKGEKPNFLNNKPYSDEYKQLAKRWHKLPVYTDIKNTQKFFELLKSKQVIILTSGTGSGKTVIIPKYYLKYLIDNNLPGKIGVTNPKILSTISSAQFNAKTLDVKLGEEVGYKYKGSPSNSISDKTRLIYLTDGLLLAQIISDDPYLSEYNGIIIDEAHERNIQIDLLLKLLKEIVLKRKEFKLIIMSATINAQIFKSYFNIKGIKYGELEIYGESNYPIKQVWANANVNKQNYLKTAISICNDILKDALSSNKNIIIFVPTQKDTIKGCELISQININLVCVEIYSNISLEKKELAVSKDLYKKEGYDMKIIFATNVAESSITFDEIDYVIDTGLELINEFDSYYNITYIKKDYTTQAQIIQRIGRTGRTNPGIAYHLYTKNKFDSLLPYPKPNILKIDLTEYILSLIHYTKTIKNFIKLSNDLITPPTKDQIDNSLHKLLFNKVIKMNSDKTNGALTKLGMYILNFKSINLVSSLAIIMSYYLKCQNEMIIIMAIVEIAEGKLDSLFVYDDIKELQNYLFPYSYPNSDHLTLLNIYLELYKNGKMKFLKTEMFNKIQNNIKLFKYYAKKISKKKYTYINKKYNLINIEPYEKLENNILYVLGKSHLYNLINKDNQTINFRHNSKATLEFSCVTKTNKDYFEYTICYQLINRFNKKLFRCITKIPKSIKIT
jgi:HrpA-like RNA helicase